jgi:hypothetical protein
MAENRRPSQRYLSGRVKVSKNAGLGTDRHLYLSPSDAEPNLGYPGEKSVPVSGSYYRLVTIPNGTTYDRYWQTDSPATLVGTANTVSKIDFVGSAITAIASGTISTISVSPPGTDKQVLFNDLDDFGAASQLFYDKSNDRIGIGVSNPTQQLHLNGDFRITGRIWDQHNQVGGASSVLIATGTGVSWSSSAGANVKISPNAPTNAVSGDLWWDSEDGDLNVYYEDVDSAAWVSANANADQEDGRWTLDSIGIHTTSNVGIGTTMASVALAVGGNAIFGGALGGTGIVTATEFHGTFIGNATGTTGGGRWSLNSAGIHTSKNVGIGSTLPGPALDIRGDLRVSGFSTFVGVRLTGPAGAKEVTWTNTTGILNFQDEAKATFGDSNDLEIYHQGNKSFIKNNNNVDYLHLQSDKISLAAESGGENFLVALKDGSVELFYDSIKRIETASSGINVVGTTTTGQLKVTGVSTFSGGIKLDNVLSDIHGQVGAARSVLTATGAGVSWGQGGSGVRIDEDPPTGNYDADLWWESDTGELHIWYDDGNSSQWVSVSQGPAGAQGAQGAQGVQGAVGAQGHQGHQGVQGTTGSQGIQGAQGHQGVVGAQGAAGAQGAQGHQGVQGATGSTGNIGAQGHQGVQGAQGATGSTGAQGHQGVQGAQGHQGHQGVQGATGAVGAQGAQGHQGVQGAVGAQGHQGHQGVQGATGSGAAGAQGAQGAQGHQGHQGVQGATGGGGGTGSQGHQGHQGVQGATGAGGAQGVQGAQGHQGHQGVQGATGGGGGTGPQGHQGVQGAQGRQGATGSGGAQGHQGVQGAEGEEGFLANNSKTSSYTLVAADDQKLINTNSNITLNQNIFSPPAAITILNNSTGNITISTGANVTMYLSGTSTTGNRTLAQKGIATIVCYSSNMFIISGGGLS